MTTGPAASKGERPNRSRAGAGVPDDELAPPTEAMLSGSTVSGYAPPADDELRPLPADADRRERDMGDGRDGPDQGGVTGTGFTSEAADDPGGCRIFRVVPTFASCHDSRPVFDATPSNMRTELNEAGATWPSVPVVGSRNRFSIGACAKVEAPEALVRPGLLHLLRRGESAGTKAT